MFGLGLAAGILVDAVLIRMAIVPSVMFLLGRSNWWFPRRLAQVLPRVSVDLKSVDVSKDVATSLDSMDAPPTRAEQEDEAAPGFVQSVWPS